MKLYSTLIRLTIIKNRRNYLFGVFLIIIALIAITIITIYIENILVMSMELPLPNLRFTFGSIQTIFCISGATFVVDQFNKIMKSNMRDISILKALGATKHNIRVFILLQAVLLIVMTLPMGLVIGIFLTKQILKFLVEVSFYDSINVLFYSGVTFFLISAGICFSIMMIGIDIEKGVRKMPPSQILSESNY